jgi:hypothetical protein
VSVSYHQEEVVEAVGGLKGASPKGMLDRREAFRQNAGMAISFRSNGPAGALSIAGILEHHT